MNLATHVISRVVKNGQICFFFLNASCYASFESWRRVEFENGHIDHIWPLGWPVEWSKMVKLGFLLTYIMLYIIRKFKAREFQKYIYIFTTFKPHMHHKLTTYVFETHPSSKLVICLPVTCFRNLYVYPSHIFEIYMFTRNDLWLDVLTRLCVFKLFRVYMSTRNDLY